MRSGRAGAIRREPTAFGQRPGVRPDVRRSRWAPQHGANCRVRVATDRRAAAQLGGMTEALGRRSQDADLLGGDGLAAVWRLLGARVCPPPRPGGLRRFWCLVR